MNLPVERSGTPPKDKRSLQAEPTPSHLLQQPDYQQLQVEAFGLAPGTLRRSARRSGEELVPAGGPRSLDGTLGQLTALRAPRGTRGSPPRRLPPWASELYRSSLPSLAGLQFIVSTQSSISLPSVIVK